MQKATVLSARNAGFSVKKRRFLKLFRVFIGIKKAHHADYQRLSYNDKNQRFSWLKDNVSANIDCICSQNMLFVTFIRSIRELTERRQNNNGEMLATQRHPCKYDTLEAIKSHCGILIDLCLSLSDSSHIGLFLVTHKNHSFSWYFLWFALSLQMNR